MEGVAEWRVPSYLPRSHFRLCHLNLSVLSWPQLNCLPLIDRADKEPLQTVSSSEECRDGGGASPLDWDKESVWVWAVQWKGRSVEESLD